MLVCHCLHEHPVLCCGAAGVVEAVLNGSTLRLTLLPERTPVTVTLAGVQCPSMGKRPPPAAAAAPAPEANGAAAEANGTAANGNGAAPAAVTAASIAAAGVTAAAAPGGAEPFAREAKWFSESRVLNREVRIPWQGWGRALGMHNRQHCEPFCRASLVVDSAVHLAAPGTAASHARRQLAFYRDGPCITHSAAQHALSAASRSYLANCWCICVG